MRQVGSRFTHRRDHLTATLASMSASVLSSHFYNRTTSTSEYIEKSKLMRQVAAIQSHENINYSLCRDYLQPCVAITQVACLDVGMYASLWQAIQSNSSVEHNPTFKCKSLSFRVPLTECSECDMELKFIYEEEDGNLGMIWPQTFVFPLPPQYFISMWDVGRTKERQTPREKRPSCSHPPREWGKRRLHLQHMWQLN
jgi:hypothetical protein